MGLVGPVGPAGPELVLPPPQPVTSTESGSARRKQNVESQKREPRDFGVLTCLGHRRHNRVLIAEDIRLSTFRVGDGICQPAYYFDLGIGKQIICPKCGATFPEFLFLNDDILQKIHGLHGRTEFAPCAAGTCCSWNPLWKFL